MTRAPIFGAIKAARNGASFTQAEVARIDALLDSLSIPMNAVIGNPISKIIAKFGKLSPEQEAGTLVILKASEGLPVSYIAYMLATAWHETNKTMQPVREAYWLSEEWRRKNLRYYPHYGRGYVQITWPANYEKADRELKLDGALLRDLDLAMQPDIAAKIMRLGMVEGWFTGKKLSDYLPAAKGTNAQFVQCRRIINGTDKAQAIADYATSFQDTLS